MLEALGATEAGFIVACTPDSPRAIPAPELAAAAESLGIVGRVGVHRRGRGGARPRPRQPRRLRAGDRVALRRRSRPFVPAVRGRCLMAPTATFVSPSKLKSNDPCWCGSGKKFKRCHKPSYDRIVPGILSPRREVPAGIEPTAVGDRWWGEQPQRARREVARRHRADASHRAGRRRGAARHRRGDRSRRHHRRARRASATRPRSPPAATRARSTTTARTPSRCAPRSTRSSATGSPTTVRCATATS